MLLHKNLPVVDYASSTLLALPPGCQVENPLEVVREDFLNFRPFYDKQKPWPFNPLNPTGRRKFIHVDFDIILIKMTFFTSLYRDRHGRRRQFQRRTGPCV